MAGKKSIAEELIEAINMPKLKLIPAYISESDATSVQEFLQYDLACEYMLDTSKITWGGETNNNHVFKMYSDYSITKDSVKLRMEMLTFMSENSTRYGQYCYLLLKMHGLDLVSWTTSITYFGNSADTLCLYALSDMLGVHTCVITRNRPWTTVDSSYNGTLDDIMKICHVNLAYLGNKKFGRLWKKTSHHQPSHVGLNYNYSAWLEEPMPPNRVELKTAHTLMDLGKAATNMEPTLECPPSTDADDAMDKIVGKLDCSVGKNLSRPDTMDLLIKSGSPVSLDVETHHTTNDHPEQQPKKYIPALDVETLKLHTTPCTVKLRRLESILFNDEPSNRTNQPAVPALDPGEHFTHSKLRPKPLRTSRQPRTVSTAVNYTEPLLSDKEKPPSKNVSTPLSTGPSSTRVAAHKQRTVHPNQRLPHVKAAPSDPNKEETLEQEFPVPTPARKQTKKYQQHQLPIKGVVKMKEYKLKKSKPNRKYSCRMCNQTVKSAGELLLHHPKKHGIIYCKFCNKAFNNQLSLSRHEYEHTLE